MKKALAAFLLSIFLYTFCGYVLVFAVLQESVSERMHNLAAGRAANLELLKVAKSEIGNSVVYNDDDEISYHGKLYDIASKTVKGDSVYFYCMNDHEEENLYAGLDANTQQNTQWQSKTQNGHSVPVIKLIVKDYFQPLPKQTKNAGFVIKSILANHILVSSTSYSSIFIPPPNQSVS